MRYTNKLNLPESFINYEVQNEHEVKDNEYSVTELLNPTQMIQLSRKYNEQLEKDVSDVIPALFGNAVHEFLEKYTKDDNFVTEQKISCEINGCILKGRVDLFNREELTICDYKTTSCNKIIKQDFDDWKMQGLMYALIMFKSQGIIIRKLKFYALLKDWSKMKAVNFTSYPSSGVYVYEYLVQDSDYDYIEEWVKNKLKDIKENNNPQCSDIDKWYTGDKFAVYKKYPNKADRVFDDKKEALDYIINKCDGVARTEVRKGQNLRCMYYCDVCKFCKEVNGD